MREWFNALFYGALIAITFRSLLLEPFNIPSGSMLPTMHVGDHIFVQKWSYGYSRYSFPFGSWNMWDGRIWGAQPEVGDVIVFRSPQNPTRDYVKRLVAVGGDTVQMQGGHLYLNGVRVVRENPRPFVMAYLRRSLRGAGWHQDNISIRGNQLFIDNEPADFNFTIEYRSDRFCNNHPRYCGVFFAVEYTETLPNGRQHSIIKKFQDAPFDNTPEVVVPENHFFFIGDNRDNSGDSRGHVGFVPRDNLIGPAWFTWYSHNYITPLIAFWNWHNKMRWSRFGQRVN